MVTAGFAHGGDNRVAASPNDGSAIVVSVRGLAPAEKFEAWRSFVRDLVEVEVETRAPAAFDGEMVIRPAGPAMITASTVADTVYERTPVLAANGRDVCTLTLCHSGYGIRLPDGVGSRMDRGSGFFLSHDRPFTITAEGDAACAVVMVDKESLADLLPRGAELGFARYEATNPVLSLIKGYLPVLTRPEASLAPEATDLAGRHLVDLIALLLRPSPDGQEIIAGRGLKAVRTRAVLDLIDRLHARPELSAATVGRELGLSSRHVHRLLEETPKTFHEHVLERRLCHAHARLVDPHAEPQPVAEIARACGFADPAHFSRCFRVRFGDTPSGVRAEALRTAMLRPRMLN